MEGQQKPWIPGENICPFLGIPIVSTAEADKPNTPAKATGKSRVDVRKVSTENRDEELKWQHQTDMIGMSRVDLAKGQNRNKFETEKKEPKKRLPKSSIVVEIDNGTESLPSSKDDPAKLGKGGLVKIAIPDSGLNPKVDENISAKKGKTVSKVLPSDSKAVSDSKVVCKSVTDKKETGGSVSVASGSDELCNSSKLKGASKVGIKDQPKSLEIQKSSKSLKSDAISGKKVTKTTKNIPAKSKNIASPMSTRQTRSSRNVTVITMEMGEASPKKDPGKKEERKGKKKRECEVSIEIS